MYSDENEIWHALVGEIVEASIVGWISLREVREVRQI